MSIMTASTVKQGEISLDTSTNINMGSSGNIIMGTGSAINYATPRTVSKSFVIEPLNNTLNATTLTITGWKYNVDANINFGVTGVTAAQWFYSRIPEVINGATLDSINLYYRINGSVRTPTNRLSMAIRRQDLTNFTGAALLATTPVTAYGTTGVGAIVTTLFTCTGNNVIDTSLYTYTIWVQEESGTGNVPGNNVYSFKCNYTVTNSPI